MTSAVSTVQRMAILRAGINGRMKKILTLTVSFVIKKCAHCAVRYQDCALITHDFLCGRRIVKGFGKYIFYFVV